MLQLQYKMIHTFVFFIALLCFNVPEIRTRNKYKEIHLCLIDRMCVYSEGLRECFNNPRNFQNFELSKISSKFP